MTADKIVEKRRAFIIHTLYFILLAGAFYLFVKYALFLFTPFLIALAVAMLLQKPIAYITKKTPLKRGLLSALFVLVFLLIIGFLLFLAGAKLATELRGLMNFLMEWLSDLPKAIKTVEKTLLDALRFLPDSLEQAARTSVSSFADKLLLQVKGEAAADAAGGLAGFDFSILKTPLSTIWTTAKQIPSALISTLVTIIASIFMTAEYPMLTGFVKRQISDEKRQVLSASKRILFSSLGKLAKSYAMILCITFIEMSVGLWILYVTKIFTGGYLIAIAAVTAVVDILPILGTGSVLIPWVLYSFAVGKTSLGIGLLVLYGVIFVLRQFLEPKLVANNLGLPSVVTIIGMYIGLQLFGFIGLFLVPVCLILLKALNDEGVLKLWKRESGTQLQEKQT